MSDYDADSTGTNFNNWTPPSYGLGGEDTSPGLKVDTSGNYQLGTGLGTSESGGGGSVYFGGSHYTPEQQQQLLNNMYKDPDFSLNQMYGTINSPLLGENEKVNWQNLSAVQKDLDVIPKLSFKPLESTDPTVVAERAKLENIPFSKALGREPTLQELKQLSERGYGNMYGVNPNNLEGQNVDHMIAAQNVGSFIGNVGQFLTRAAMPAPISMALTGIQAYNNYQKNGDWKQALAQAMGGAGGYAGAVGQALQGNYGSALTGALSKGGANPLVSMTTGTALDAATGKNVNQNLGQIAGYALGRQQGGAPGAVLGAFAGRSLANIFGKTK